MTKPKKTPAKNNKTAPAKKVGGKKPKTGHSVIPHEPPGHQTAARDGTRGMMCPHGYGPTQVKNCPACAVDDYERAAPPARNIGNKMTDALVGARLDGLDTVTPQKAPRKKDANVRRGSFDLPTTVVVLEQMMRDLDKIRHSLKAELLVAQMPTLHALDAKAPRIDYVAKIDEVLEDLDDEAAPTGEERRITGADRARDPQYWMGYRAGLGKASTIVKRKLT